MRTEIMNTSSGDNSG